jgi:hypothetical protein
MLRLAAKLLVKALGLPRSPNNDRLILSLLCVGVFKVDCHIATAAVSFARGVRNDAPCPAESMLEAHGSWAE